MLDSTAKFTPPVPVPRAEPLGLIALLRTLKNNPLEAWTQAHFEQPVVMGGLSIGRVAVVSDPGAIRRVLLENSANYRKDWMQRRILSAGLANGLLSAEGGQWKAQRRALAPLFSRKAVLAFSAAMVDSAQALVERLGRHQDQVVDVAVEATRTTLDVLERTIFSDGFGRGAEEIRVAMKSYFDTIGRIDLFDLLGVPAAVPRPSRWRLRPMLRLFEDAIDTIIATRRRQIADGQARRAARYFDAAARSARSGNRRGAQREPRFARTSSPSLPPGRKRRPIALPGRYICCRSRPNGGSGFRRKPTASSATAKATWPTVSSKRAPLIEETNRLYPPLAAMSRAALGPDELAGRRDQPRHNGGHRALCAAPPPRAVDASRTSFDPNRFLNGAREKIDRYAYLPFGAGPRICIGATFAIQEATIVLAAIMRNLDLELAPGHAVWPVLKVTLRPKGGLPMIVRRRIR